MCAPRRHTVRRVCIAVVAVAGLGSVAVPVMLSAAASVATVALVATGGVCVVAVGVTVWAVPWYLRHNPAWKPAARVVPKPAVALPAPRRVGALAAIDAVEARLEGLPLTEALKVIEAETRRMHTEGRKPATAVVIERKDEAWSRR